MKGYYIFAPVEEGAAGHFSGVEKKIRSFCSVIGEKYQIVLEVFPPFKQEDSRVKRVLKRWMLWTPVGHDWSKLEAKYLDADFLYIRKAQHDASFLKFVKLIKKKKPSTKILYEIPTYPYETEQKLTIGNFPNVVKDRLFRKSLHKYIDRIVTFYNQDEIIGIPTIRVMNGYDFSKIRKPSYTLYNEEIHMIEVSTTAFWHGYDRVIEGLKNYYCKDRKIKIVFHMVGPFLEEHKEMVKEYNLEEYVIFHGKLSGEKLDEVYNKCSIGVDVLGGHRKDYPISSSLKSREYAEKGIPLITSSPVDYLPKDCPYQMICPYDDSPIDMESVIVFYEKVFSGHNVYDVATSIQDNAIKLCDFHITLKPIIDYLDGKNE